MPCVHSGAACDRPETTKTLKLPPIPEAVWQEPPETFIDQYNLNITKKDSTIQYTQETQMTDVASQASPPKEIQPQNYVMAAEEPPGNQTGNEPVPFLSCSNNCSTDIQKSREHTTTTLLEIPSFHFSRYQPH